MFITQLFIKRTILVRCSSVLSPHFIWMRGVFQGNVFSILLSEISLNDIVDSIHDPVKPSLYVDGPTLSVSGSLVAHIELQLQLATNKITAFGISHGFRFCPSKTRAEFFRKKVGRGNYFPWLYSAPSVLPSVFD